MTAEGEELEQAIARLQSELQQYRARGDQRNEGITLHRLGTLFQNHGRPEQARACYEQALSILQRLDDFQAQVATLHNLGTLLAREQPEQARRYYEQALLILRQTGDRRGEAFTLHNLGQLYENLEQSEPALACYQQALAILRTLGEPGNEAVTVINLGRLAERRERYDEARRHYQEARRLLQQAGDPEHELLALKDLGRLACRQERYEEAQSLYEEARALCQRLGDPYQEAVVLISLAEVYEERELLLQSRAAYEHLLAFQSESSGSGHVFFPIHFNLGRVYHQLALTERARRHFEQALALTLTGDLPPYCEYLSRGSLGRLLQDLSRPVEAFNHYRQALQGFSRISYIPGLIQTLCLLGSLLGRYGQLQAALAHFLQARAIAESQNNLVARASIDKELAPFQNLLGPEEFARLSQQTEPLRGVLIDATLEGIVAPTLVKFEQIVLPSEQLCPLIERVSLALGGESPSQEKQQLLRELQQRSAQAQTQSGGDSEGLTAAAAAADFYAALAALLEGRSPALPRDHPYSPPLVLIQDGQARWRASRAAGDPSK
ncbi:tetratricopeptide repeat protein [Thermogemmatispora tikiterensis]|uniref:Uncharacterized protein n=1 Tax=Thermogemmatispora tikiterensis TaxID=1825093 RepID=A0A328VQ94_9CHLR|nr:tetratricopeptide repeat protein [Thermogemmatispora tikiterensis]RAQ96295.1 hypothetical protein A4R35_12185 [Thermogemmatispora tikiterensis]